MSAKKPKPLSHCSMLELFRVEVENQAILLTEGLLALEREPGALQHLEVLMRAAHSVKGAARLVNHHLAKRVAHAMEDCFVAAQKGTLTLLKPRIDVLLQGIDLLIRLAQAPEATIESGVPEPEHEAQIEAFLGSLSAPTETDAAPGARQLAVPGPTAPSPGAPQSEGDGPRGAGPATADPGLAHLSDPRPRHGWLGNGRHRLAPRIGRRRRLRPH